MIQSTQYIVLCQEASEFLIKMSYYCSLVMFIHFPDLYSDIIRLPLIVGQKLIVPLKYFMLLSFLSQEFDRVVFTSLSSYEKNVKIVVMLRSFLLSSLAVII